MVAITTDTHHRRHVPAPGRAVPVHLRPATTAGGTPALPAATVQRVLLVVAAVAVVLVVAVGTAALGRLLDAQRGIPVSGAPPVATAPAS